MDLSINPKKVLAVLLCIIAFLVLMHVAQLVVYYYIDDPDVFDFIELVDLDYEGNLPALYSHLAIFFAAALLWMITLQKRKAAHGSYRHHWLVLATIFTFLGFDEALALHEDVGDLFEENEWVNATGFLYFAWVVPYGVLLLVFAIAYLKFVFTLPRETMILFILSGTLFVSGAMGIEVFSAREADLNGSETMLYSALYTAEEILEMSAIALFCYALLQYIQKQYGSINFSITA